MTVKQNKFYEYHEIMLKKEEKVYNIKILKFFFFLNPRQKDAKKCIFSNFSDFKEQMVYN